MIASRDMHSRPRHRPARSGSRGLRLALATLQLVVCVLVVVSCSTEPSVEEPTTCEDNASCPAGSFCAIAPAGGKPVSSCHLACDPTGDSSECPKGEFCEDFARDPARGYCSPRCTSDGECSSGQTCDRETGACRCASDEACDRRLEASLGESFACREGSCTLRCSRDLDCSCGSVCDAGACRAGCRADADCCGTSTCEEGHCTPPGPASDGSRCYRSEDCESSICVNGVYPRGMCVPKVVDRCKVDGCPAGTACDVVFVPWAGAMIGVCAPGCDTDADCREGAVCRPSETRSGGPEKRVCTPTCTTDVVCGSDGRCSAEESTCACASDAWCKPYGSLATCVTASQTCTCTPNCEGKACGDDGCGGSCGKCAEGYECGEGGQCVGSCGTSTPYTVCSDGSYCPPNSTCEGGRCTCASGYVRAACDGACPSCSLNWTCKVCTPSCSGRECGGDGCGGSCGSCPSGMFCSNGTCTTQGGGGGGGGCPSGCPAGTTCVTNQGCVSTCTSHASCSSGCCASLTNGQRICAPAANCGGGGGVACHDRTSCISGRVTYPTGLGHCAGKMVGWMRNNCSVPVWCRYCLGTDCGNGSTIAPGAEHGGELGGVWSCGQTPGAQLRYLCADPSDRSACTEF